MKFNKYDEALFGMTTPVGTKDKVPKKRKAKAKVKKASKKSK